MSMAKAILVLDEGTTSTRAILYSAAGTVLGIAQEELQQHYPAPGWVEHDATEIWERTLRCAHKMVELAGGADRIAAIGITNQRETAVAWDRETGQPVCRAIVWQDRRTEAHCRALRDEGHEAAVSQSTGLLLDPYFSATKYRWILDNVPEARALGSRLALGTVESWLVWNLTGGLHVSDVTNASRTALFPLAGTTWDAGLCDLFGVPMAALPEVVPNAGVIGHCRADWLGGAIPICGLAGDQQAATIGQGCTDVGSSKATLGTGAFILANMGTAQPRSANRLLGTVLYQLGEERIFALEGSVFAAGSIIKWLRDSLGILSSSDESAELARSVADNGGVTFLPALAGLGAPYWLPEAKAAISGLTFASTRAHIVRGALEAISHIFVDLAQAFAADGAAWQVLRIDGGMSANDWLAQDLADMLGLRCDRPDDIETTARGAAMLAAVGSGLYPSLRAAMAMLPAARTFQPQMEPAARQERLVLWHAELAKLTR